ISLTAADHTPYSITTGGVIQNVSGTSASAPSMAGIVTLLNQYLLANGTIKQPGLGNINPTLYRMAQLVPGAFHDVTTGDNLVPCVQSSLDCVNGQAGFRAGPGYDQVTGLGSVDAFLLIGNWASAAGIPTTISLTTDANQVDLNGLVKLTATVTGAGSGTLSGTVSFGVSQSAAVLGSASVVASGNSGVATLTIPANMLTVGSATLYAAYSGDAAFNSSGGTTQLTVTNPAAGVSAVVLIISPSPVFLKTKDAPGVGWSFTLQVHELAGVATTLTGFLTNGTAVPLSSFFSRTALTAKGTISTLIVYTGTDPSRVFTVTGQDASGRTWQQSVTATFVNKQGSNGASMALISAAGSIQQDLSNTSCPWSQKIFLQEQSGYTVFLFDFFVGNDDRSDQIQQIFGTTRLAPLGVLSGTVCWNSATLPAADSYFVDGLADSGSFISSTLSATFSAAAASTAHALVSPAAIVAQISDASQSASAVLTLNFDAGTPTWTAGVFPTTRTTSWLQLSSKSGAGFAQLTIKANAAGLSNGVYNATILIRSANATPQYISVPVSFTVGASSSISIGGVSNAFSGIVAAAPGMLVSVYGSGLAPAIQHAPSVPLALSMQNVSATVNGISAPILDILPGQLNIQIPYETSAGPAVLGVTNNGQVASFPVLITAASPGQWPHFIGISGVVVSSAKRGDVLLTFITGEGQVFPDLPNGAAPPFTTDARALPTPLLPLTVTVGGSNANVGFGGIPNYLTGVTQVNFTVPSDAPLGPQMVVISVGGVQGNPVPLTITQ
ncbi:MAG: Ig-like domain repeat protein, partial [Acidobacteriota bacterium]